MNNKPVLSNVSPKAEPIAWGTVSALIVGTLIDYGFPVSSNLAELLSYILPFILFNAIARFVVFAPDTVK